MPIGSENVLQEFLIRFGFRMDQMSANAALQSMGSVGGRLNAIARVGVTAFRAISGEIYRTAMDMGRLSATAERIGMSASTLDRLLMAANAAGSTEADALRSITQLQGMIGDAALRLGRGANVFRMFGINVYDVNGKLRTTESILQEIAVRFRGVGGEGLLDPRVRNTLAKQFGISEDFARVLAGDFGEMLELTNQVGKAFNYNIDEMTDKAKTFRKEISLSKNILTIIRRSLVGGGLDYLNNRLFRFNRNLANNSKNLSVYGKGFVAILKLILSVIDATASLLMRIFSGIGWILEALGPLGTAITSLGISFGVLATAILTFTGLVGVPLLVATAKFLAVAAAVTLVVLALEDLWSFFKGEKSITGLLWEDNQEDQTFGRKQFRIDRTYLLKYADREIPLIDREFDPALPPKRKIASSEFDSLGELFDKLGGFWDEIKDYKGPRPNRLWINDLWDKIKAAWKERQDETLAFVESKSSEQSDDLNATIDRVLKSLDSGFNNVKNSIIEGTQDLISSFGEWFKNLIDSFSIRNIIEAIKEALWFTSDTKSTPGEIPPEEGPKSGLGKTINDMVEKLRESQQKQKIDSKYGLMEDGTSYSKWLGTWYYNRKGQKQKFGYNFSDEAIEDDKFFAENAHNKDFLDVTLVPKDKIPVSESLGVDVNEPATDDNNGETLPIGTVVGEEDNDPVAFNPFGSNPQLMADTNKVVNTNVSAPQNISVHNNFTIDGAKDAHLVANEVISNQYRVMTNVASILRPLPTTMV